MEFVCPDFNGSKWFWDGSVFIKKDASDKILYKFNGENIPNPHSLWINRCKAIGAPMGSDHHNGERLKPTDAVFSLFSFWEGINNGNPNA